MQRPFRLAIGVLVLLLLAGGTALAMRTPSETGSPAAPASSHEADDALEPAAAERMAQRLGAAGIETDAATVAQLADLHGAGNAVRLLAWADATGLAVDEIAALRADGLGWGRLARQLDPDGSLGLHPGLGWIMGRGADAGDDPGAAGGPPRHPLGGPPGQQGDGEADDDGS